MSTVDDDDGVGLGTDGPLISLKTHEDSWARGVSVVATGVKACPQKSRRGPLHPWGPKHRANHHMSYVYAYSCTSVMHVCENMLRSSLAYAARPPCTREHAIPRSRYRANGRHVSPVAGLNTPRAAHPCLKYRAGKSRSEVTANLHARVRRFNKSFINPRHNR